MKLAIVGRAKSLTEKRDFEKSSLDGLEAEGKASRLLDIAKVQHHLYLVIMRLISAACVLVTTIYRVKSTLM